MTAVIVTDPFDPTADLVVTELEGRGIPVFRFDTGEFPLDLTVTAETASTDWTGQIDTPRRSLDLATVTGLYYRRPTAFTFAPELTTAERQWAGVQARLGLGGLLAAIGPWLNHPHHVGYAEYKPAQLRLAREVGLHVPRTCLTNDPHAARRFLASVGRAIYKPLGGTSIVDDTGARAVFATPVTADECHDSIATTMHLFQEWVPKNHEIRLTVVDDQFFAARIDARSDAAHLDWRRDYTHLDYRAVDTPAPVRHAVTELLSRLRLRFGALDFVIDDHDRWWFLECNPNGQWGWIEDHTGLPIAAALADALQGSHRVRPAC